MSTLERMNFRALAIKEQAAIGVDAIAGSPATADWVGAQFEIAPDIDMIPNPTYSASLDPRPPFPGGERFVMQRVTMPLRGSGTAGTEPEWFRIFRSAGMAQVDTPAAIGAPTAATAGTGINATLQAPFVATGDAYLGMPFLLTGNPAAGQAALCTRYQASRVATFDRTFSPPLSTATLAQIPVHNLLKLTDTEADFKRFTCYAYKAGMLYIGVDCIALNPEITLVAGQPGTLSFDILGPFYAAGGPTETALPAAPAAIVRPQPPRWAGGVSQFNRGLARADRFTLRLGSAGILTPNPEQPHGFGAAELMSRNPTAELSLMTNSTDSPSRVGLVRAGADCIVSAILGTTAGNRIGILFSPAKATAIRPGAFGGAEMDVISLVNGQAGASVWISAF
jgi:hypothetical protein